MTTLREAAQQALERLMLHHRTWDARDDLNAITALRAALEQPEHDPLSADETEIVAVSEIGATVFLPRRGQGEGPNLKCDEYAHETNGDLQAATRRAIVRAAAAIGKEMK